MRLLLKSNRALVVLAFLALAASVVTASPPQRVARDPGTRTTVITTREAYEKLCRDNPANELVPVPSLIPDIRAEVRYASRDNFLGRALYPDASLFLTRIAAEKLARVQADLRQHGLGLRLYDSYRPYSISETMWKESGKKFAAYLAPPWLGSDHNRGIAVDADLVRLPTGTALPFPTDYDDFTPKAWHGSPCDHPQAASNRERLRTAMRSHGFVEYRREWWHYHLAEAEGFPLLDISHSELARRERRVSAQKSRAACSPNHGVQKE